MAIYSRFHVVTLVVAVALILSGKASALTPEQVERIDVYPPDVRLEGATDRQRFIVVATSADGVTHDVTELASAKVSEPNLVRLEKNMLHPVADGKLELEVEHAGKKSTVPVSVIDAGKARPVSFEMDVMPVFTRAGCNTGGCHGRCQRKRRIPTLPLWLRSGR